MFALYLIPTLFVVYILVGLLAPIIALEQGYAGLSEILSWMVYVPLLTISAVFIVASLGLELGCKFALQREPRVRA